MDADRRGGVKEGGWELPTTRRALRERGVLLVLREGLEAVEEVWTFRRLEGRGDGFREGGEEGVARS